MKKLLRRLKISIKTIYGIIICIFVIMVVLYPMLNKTVTSKPKIVLKCKVPNIKKDDKNMTTTQLTSSTSSVIEVANSIIHSVNELNSPKVNENLATDSSTQIVSTTNVITVTNLTTATTTTINPINGFNNTQELKKAIDEINNKSIIFNKHFIKTSNDSINSNLTVLLVQVNKRVQYLSALIDSLSNVRGINTTLLIFSHDFYDQQLNEVIKKIQFCSYMQIFYPYSIQIYDNKFPGFDPNDCVPMNISKQEALNKSCNNAEYPDMYGNYRSFDIVQIKHHWWWKISYVFDKMIHTRVLNNLTVLLLEEDYFLMPDTLYMLSKMTERIKSDLQIVSLGLFREKKQFTQYSPDSHKYKEEAFTSDFHNTGMCITRPIWNKIKGCTNEFCTYDDYNWDWTLQYIGRNCLRPTFMSLVPLVSRVVHIGECGIHHKSSSCDPSLKVNELKKQIENNNSRIFPLYLELHSSLAVLYNGKPNGGWADIRDHMLCKSFVDSNSSFLI